MKNLRKHLVIFVKCECVVFQTYRIEKLLENCQCQCIKHQWIETMMLLTQFLCQQFIKYNKNMWFTKWGLPALRLWLKSFSIHWKYRSNIDQIRCYAHDSTHSSKPLNASECDVCILCICTRRHLFCGFYPSFARKWIYEVMFVVRIRKTKRHNMKIAMWITYSIKLSYVVVNPLQSLHECVIKMLFYVLVCVCTALYPGSGIGENSL